MTRRHREQSFEVQPMEPPCERIGECALINNLMVEACPPASLTTNPTPLLAAEEVCPLALRRQTERYAGKRSEKFTFSYACSLIERAIADDSLSAAEKSEYIAGAGKELEAILAEKNQSAEKWLHTGIIHAYLGAFQERALGKPVSQETIGTTYRNMTKLLEAHEGLSRRDIERSAGLRVEIEVNSLLLSTRDPRNFPWPALQREEISTQKQYNHDSYVLREDGKVPIQIKRGGERFRKIREMEGKERQLGYSDRVAVIVYSSLEAPHPDEIAEPYDPLDQYVSYDPAEQQRRIVWGAGEHAPESTMLSIKEELILDSMGYHTTENTRLLSTLSTQLLETIDDVEPTNLANYPKAA